MSDEGDSTCVPAPPEEPPTCNVQTGGHCATFGCESWRGPTRCFEQLCLCQLGFCVSDGKCVSGQSALIDTLELGADEAMSEGPASSIPPVVLLSSLAMSLVLAGYVARVFGWRPTAHNVGFQQP